MYVCHTNQIGSTINRQSNFLSISIIYLPSGTRGVVAQSPEPEAHDKSD